jgi:putative ABC transport system permease protein
MHGTRRSAEAPAPPRSQPAKSAAAIFRLALRIALRDLRGGLKGFGIFIACLALGVMTIAAVSSLSRGLSEGLSREGRRILGGDAAFTLIHREATPDERSTLAGFGAVSQIATLRGMANAGDKGAALVEIKAVDGLYPAIGTLATEPSLPATDLLRKQGDSYGGIVDPVLLARLDLKVGDEIMIGAAQVVLRAALASEPDKIATGVGFGPRLILSQEALRATGLLQPGSLVRWSYRLILPPATNDDRRLAQVLADTAKALPEAGWEVRSRVAAAPQFQRNLERFTQFLTLVGLTALLVGGVGVANAVRRFVEAKRLDFATLKALGATGGLVVLIHLSEVMLVAALGITIGLFIGASLPFILAHALAGSLPLPFEPTLAFTELGIAALYGFLTALVFAILPLGRAHDVPVSALFRDGVQPDTRRPRLIYLAAFALALAGLVGVSVLFAYDRRVALIYVGASGLIFVLLRLLAAGLMRLAASLPRPRNVAARLALANVHRPGALTPSLVLSLGLGVALLATLAFIDSSLTRQLTRNLPDKAPGYFFLDIPNAQTQDFEAFLGQQSPGAKIERVPMMRGRIVSLNGVRAEEIKAAEQAAWVLEGDRGITYAVTPPEGSVISAGEWWPAGYGGAPLVSFDREIAAGLGLKVGDTIVVNVLGRDISARIANLRQIEWRNMGINFVMVFSPNTFAGAPHTHLATLTSAGATSPQADGDLMRALSRSFPSVTAVRVKDALEAVNDVVGKLALAIRGASLLAIAASLLVLAGALAAGQRARLYDAMILKTLGATRARIIGAYLLEYGAIGVAAALFGLIAGTAAGWGIVTRVMKIAFAPDPTGAILTAFGAIGVAVIFGLAGTLRILGQKPASHLRSL